MGKEVTVVGLLVKVVFSVTLLCLSVLVAS